jgi:hypothetical protein
MNRSIEWAAGGDTRNYDDMVYDMEMDALLDAEQEAAEEDCQ